MPERRAALRSLVSRVLIAPGRAHAAERVVIEFVDGSRLPFDWESEEGRDIAAWARSVATEEITSEEFAARLAARKREA